MLLQYPTFIDNSKQLNKDEMKTTKAIFNGSLKAILAAAVITPMMTSCLDDGETTFGYIYGPTDYIYANTKSVNFGFQVSGTSWSLSKTESASWCTFGQSTGTGPFTGYVPLSFTKNTTGEARTVYCQLESSDGATANNYIYQAASRGDGSLGSAPMVSRITGTDGSEVTLTYDTNDCPSTITATKDGTTLFSYAFTYNGADTTLYVRDAQTSAMMSGTYNSAWAPSETMTGANDTVTWECNGTTIGSSTRFGVTRRQKGGMYNTQTVQTNGLSNIDTDIIVRSFEFEDRDASGNEMSKTMAVTLGAQSDGSDYVSNRNQNIDVNQLLFGIDHCNPYMLLGLYRWSRCAYIYKSVSSSLKSDTSSYTIATTLNIDKSVNTMTVTDGNGAETIYTFEY